MTVKLLTDCRNPADGKLYKVGNLLSVDAGTETGLVATKLADSNLTGGTAYVAPAIPEAIDEVASPLMVIKFAYFRHSLLASLVAGATAARTNGIVTVTATAHGIITGTTYVGFRFFYPGSPSLAAGWFDSILSIPDANSLTFSAPGPNFTSESVNAGAAYTTQTTIQGSVTIPGAELTDQSIIRLSVPSGGGLTGATKSVRPILSGTGLSVSAATGFPFAVKEWEIFSLGPTLVGSMFIQYNGASSSYVTATVDKSQDITCALAVTVSASADFIVLPFIPRIQLVV